jgi:hypothetical protein
MLESPIALRHAEGAITLLRNDSKLISHSVTPHNTELFIFTAVSLGILTNVTEVLVRFPKIEKRTLIKFRAEIMM